MRIRKYEATEMIYDTTSIHKVTRPLTHSDPQKSCYDIKAVWHGLWTSDANEK